LTTLKYLAPYTAVFDGSNTRHWEKKMKSIFALLHLAALAGRAASSASPDGAMVIDNESGFAMMWNTSQRLLEELGPLLSEKASILTPASKEWDQTRSSSPRIEPQFIASVEVATEKDVQETVKTYNQPLRQHIDAYLS
jgi:hypothetical protein